MPLFEYVCKSCGHQFEYLVQTGDSDPEKCPECGTKAPAKKISSFAVSVPSGTGAGSPPPSCPTGTCPFA